MFGVGVVILVLLVSFTSKVARNFLAHLLEALGVPFFGLFRDIGIVNGGLQASRNVLVTYVITLRTMSMTRSK